MFWRNHLTSAACYGVAVASMAVLCSSPYAQVTLPTALQATAAQAVLKENGSIVTMPPNGIPSRKTGLSLTVDTHWANGYGYRPVEVRVQSRKPTTADHLITIRLHFGYESDMCVEQDFEMPTGSTMASTIVAVPTYEQANNFFWWEAWVDGAKDPDLSLDKEDGWQTTFNSGGTSVGTLQILVAGRDANHQLLVSPSMFDFEVLSWKLANFPHRWIEYTCLDVVSLSLVELQQLQQTNPLAFEAVGRWVRSGGQLWISDVGDKLEQLPQLSKLLGIPDVMASSNASTESKAPADDKNAKPEPAKTDWGTESGWRPAHIGNAMPGGQLQAYTDMRTGRTRWTGDPRVIAQLDRDPNYNRIRGQGMSSLLKPEQRAARDSGDWYVEQRLGLGLVWAFRGANEAEVFAHGVPVNAIVAANSNVVSQIPEPLAFAASNARQWEMRHGILPDVSNPDFGKFMMPDIGRAPVTQFQVLITLFVLMIGPFNYWLLKRFKRLQLLVLTVPLAAGFATLALFAYATMSDGFGTTVRARSVTMLDQRTGEATCWSRLSYYSGMAPGRGLTMPADVAVFPVFPNWSSESSRAINRLMVWDDKEAKHTRGWLMSRTPTQYLTLRARQTSNKIEIVSGAGKMQVTNRLGTPIELLFVINEEGRFFRGEELKVDSRTPLQPVSREEAGREFAQVVRDHPFEPPPELAGSDRDFTGRRPRTPRRVYGRYRPQPTIDQSLESLADRTIADLAGMNGQAPLGLPPRSYVAVTTSGAEVETGIEKFREEASFHVIVGQW